MKCVIGGAHLRVFGRAIHAIARISDEFWFDPIEKGLALRSVNSSRSAYAYVFFSSMFFQHYCWTAVSQPCQKEKQLSVTCKLVIKSVLPIFRCVNVLERNVEKCSISANTDDHHITFQFLCRHGVVKTYNLTFQECDPLQAVFAKNMCPNVLKVHSRLLADIMIHFPNSQEEITLSVTPMKVCFKSYTEEDADEDNYLEKDDCLERRDGYCAENKLKLWRARRIQWWKLSETGEKLLTIKRHGKSNEQLVTLLVTNACQQSRFASRYQTMLTEIQLHPDEFDYFQVGVDSEVTFCLKELRGLLAFSEATSVPVSIHFDISGRPIAFSIEDTVLEASFIFATLSEVEKEMASQQASCSSQQQESSKACAGKTENTSMDKNHSTAGASKKSQWSRNAPKTESAESASPWAKRENKGVSRVQKRDTRGMERTTIIEAKDHAKLEGESETHSQKFHSLFFGAVSFKEKDTSSHTLHSLATASDTEEDFSNLQSSPAL